MAHDCIGVTFGPSPRCEHLGCRVRERADHRLVSQKLASAGGGVCWEAPVSVTRAAWPCLTLGLVQLVNGFKEVLIAHLKC